MRPIRMSVLRVYRGGRGRKGEVVIQEETVEEGLFCKRRCLYKQRNNKLKRNRWWKGRRVSLWKRTHVFVLNTCVDCIIMCNLFCAQSIFWAAPTMRGGVPFRELMGKTPTHICPWAATTLLNEFTRKKKQQKSPDTSSKSDRFHTNWLQNTFENSTIQQEWQKADSSRLRRGKRLSSTCEVSWWSAASSSLLICRHLASKELKDVDTD